MGNKFTRKPNKLLVEPGKGICNTSMQKWLGYNDLNVFHT